MSVQLEQAFSEASDWFARARAAGWLSETDAAALDRIERAAPGDLFDDYESRPLVVAFFGGTGVGKSSLLNRLAGVDLARTGVERPTSREVTLFAHESVALHRLDDQLPLEHVCVKRHSDTARRDVLWIDMPDIDSTAPENRELALTWFAYIDLVVYVVSP
ncbi:MAG: GTP-binding protein, partial [Planctomycetota bacterium]